MKKKRRTKYGTYDIRDIYVRKKIAYYRKRLKSVIAETRQKLGYCDFCKRAACCEFTCHLCTFHRGRLLDETRKRKIRLDGSKVR